MCCLFGIIDYGNQLTARQKNDLITALSIAAEERGTDATGIAYNDRGHLRIYKRPFAAHHLHFHIPGEASIVMGHTRMATQGDARRNCNNHPFLGHVKNVDFALAHNGVLYNDYQLRARLKLPDSPIETDSYIAVQLIEKKKVLDFNSLKAMAEALEGSFTMTVLSETDRLYFVKGDSPLTVCRFPKAGVYLYASTAEILNSALRGYPNRLGEGVEIPVSCGELLSIDKVGSIERSAFDAANLLPYPRYYPIRFSDDPYVQELKAMASCFGYTAEDIDELLLCGFMPEDIEEYFYECRGTKECLC